ncbi:MAG: leucyl/phenylalanyl-tRNA--protein transferase [bacterium]|nr:leucyl/phenylalanyl-tRNA--protein transferase [bacterium]
MPVYLLDQTLRFPPVSEAEDGLLAVGGDLSPERLILAYRTGVFPWFGEGEPILWHSPDPRSIIRPSALRVSQSLRRTIAKQPFRVTLDTAFAEVVAACAEIERPTQDGTWITDEMQAAYVVLHERGLAHSVELWDGERLVGGLYGVSLGGAYFGESMFSRERDASKIGLVTLAGKLEREGFTLIDCQIPSEHLTRFGAVELSRAAFMVELAEALKLPTREGRWEL